jgi:deoxyuridine 5'-triphosphate nucleotidohydrolase
MLETGKLKILKDELRSRYGHKINMETLATILVLEEIRAEQTIGIQYTSDEYGEAAAELGVPQKAYSHDAGIDLPITLSKEDREHGKIIWPGERERLHTGMIMDFPIGWHARIIHRSSTEKRHRLRVVEGTIDDYRGELLVQVHNGNDCKIEVYHGQKLGQLILHPTAPFGCEVRDLRPSERGVNGFGSTTSKDKS